MVITCIHAVKHLPGSKDFVFINAFEGTEGVGGLQSLDEPTPAAALAELDVPVLLMVGSKSPLSSRAVAQRLADLLPQVERVELEGLGHMGPVTHPDKVNEVIVRFLERHAVA